MLERSSVHPPLDFYSLIFRFLKIVLLTTSTICLGMTQRGEMVYDGEIGTKQLELVIVELLPIVKDYYLWDSKSAHNIFPEEILDILLGDSGKRLCLDPLGEVIYDNQQKLFLQWSSR